LTEVMRAVGNTVTLAIAAALIGFTLGLFFGLIAGYFRDTWIDKVATSIAIAGVSVPHYWLGMVMVIIFSVQLNWLPAVGAGSGGSAAWAWDWDHLKYLVLPAITTSVTRSPRSPAPADNDLRPSAPPKLRTGKRVPLHHSISQHSAISKRVDHELVSVHWLDRGDQTMTFSHLSGSLNVCRLWLGILRYSVLHEAANAKHAFTPSNH
jgi:hypothetical protein